MSSQHLEEADELADRALIMTKGQILASDTPEAIKQKYGFGYKLLIEAVGNNELTHLKSDFIEPAVLTHHNMNHGVKENSDSTPKQLIYQFPFQKDAIIEAVLNQLKSEVGDRIRMELELNSLEDAYLNIAKDEEFFLKQRKLGERSGDIEMDDIGVNLDEDKNGQNFEEVDKYQRIEAHPTMIKQLLATT